MQLGQNLKQLREQNGLLQKQVASELGIGVSHYSKMENNQRDVSVEVLVRLAQLYGLSIDQIVRMDSGVPQQVTIEDKPMVEQLRLLDQLGERDKQIIFDIIDTMLTRQKFQTFFEENLAAH